MKLVDVIGRRNCRTDNCFIFKPNSTKTTTTRDVASRARVRAGTISIANVCTKMQRYSVPIDYNCLFGRHASHTILLLGKKVKLTLGGRLEFLDDNVELYAFTFG